LAGRFGFDARLQSASVPLLSGGERRRLELLRALMAAPNVLVLDEPTNDLDLDTLAALEDHLDGFTGTLLVASHDRYVLDRPCCPATSRARSAAVASPWAWPWAPSPSVPSGAARSPAAWVTASTPGWSSSSAPCWPRSRWPGTRSPAPWRRSWRSASAAGPPT